MSMVGGGRTEDDKGSRDNDAGEAVKADQESAADKEIEKESPEARAPGEESKKDAG